MPYSDDLRQSVLHAVATSPLSKAALATLFGVSRSFIDSVVRRRKQTGSTKALPHAGGPRPTLSEAQQQALRAQVQAHPHLLLRELVAWLQREQQVTLSVSGLCRLLQRLGLPRKKERGTRSNATQLPASRRVPTGVPQ